MKTSTNILLVYVALILAIILTLFILSKNNVNLNREEPVVTTLPLEASFNVLVVDSFCVCQVTQKDSTYLQWTHRDDSLDYGDLTRLSHDTLYVIKSPTREPNGLVIYCPSIKTLIAKNGSTVAMTSVLQDSLTIITCKGEVYLWDYRAVGVNNKDTLALTVLADSGDVRVETAFRSLTATMNGGKLIAQQTIGQAVNLTLSNNASVRLAKSPADMTVKNDQTSKVEIGD